MTYLDLMEALRELDLDVAYGEFKQSTSPPFCIVLEDENDDLYADNSNHKKITSCSIEYYNDIKHPPTEEMIEDKLDEMGLTYQKRGTPIESESMFQIVYDLQII